MTCFSFVYTSTAYGVLLECVGSIFLFLRCCKMLWGGIRGLGGHDILHTTTLRNKILWKAKVTERICMILVLIYKAKPERTALGIVYSGEDGH